MANGVTKEDVANWAGGAGGNPGNGDPANAGGGAEPAPDEDEDQGGDEEEAGPKDPCDILKAVSEDLEKRVAAMKGYTLPDDTAKSFKKKWDKMAAQLEDVKSDVDDLTDEHEEDHEEPEEDEEEDDDSDEEGGGDSDDEGADDESDE